MLYRGIIERGERRGTALGFPTANIPLADTRLSGIHIARANLRGREYQAAVFIDPARKILETHLLDFPFEDLYGETIEVELVEKLREHELFENDADLQKRIHEDLAVVRDFFSRT